MSASHTHPLFQPAPNDAKTTYARDLVKIIDMELQHHHPLCPIKVVDPNAALIDLARIVLYLLQGNRRVA